LIGLVSLDDSDLVVRGHERVLDKPLADRLNLIRKTEANEGLIFGLFSDPGQTVDILLQELSKTGPDIEVTDDFSVINRLWCISDPEKIKSIQLALKNNSLYIADGHHRYQTSVVFHRECQERGWRTVGDESYDKRMMALFNMNSPGMRILATHRAIRNLENFDSNQFVSRLSEHFEVRELEGQDEFKRIAGKKPGIGLAIASPLAFYWIRVKESSIEDPNFMQNLKGVARELDVNLLHEGILSPLLGIGIEELASQNFVEYHRYRNQLLQKLADGDYQMGFFLNPTTLEQVMMISEEGKKMPQKSTDFFPKLLTGMVMMKMEIGK
jgi:uncharacterized protein (DUF1015 family)